MLPSYDICIMETTGSGEDPCFCSLIINYRSPGADEAVDNDVHRAIEHKGGVGQGRQVVNPPTIFTVQYSHRIKR